MENPVIERLKSLTWLQVLDTKLDEIYRLRGSLPDEVKDLEDDLEGLETRYARIQDEIKGINSEISGRKGKIQDFKSQIKKYEEQQKNVKNNREYEALTKEVEYANLEILTSEKKIKKFQEQIVQKQELLEQTHKQVEEKKHELDEKQKELNVIIEDTMQEEKKLRQAIVDAETGVENRYLQGYRKIKNSMRNGLAVVYTDRSACGGCFSIIPPQVLIDLKQKTRLIHCENCGRILVDESFFQDVKQSAEEL